MKYLIVAAACLVSIGAASAQSGPAPTLTPEQQAYVAAHPSRCPAVPAAPELADGARGRAPAMNAANERYNAWVLAIGPALVCRQAEARELRVAYEAAQALAETRVREFNAGVAMQSETCRGWMAEIQEFRTATRDRNPVEDMCNAPPPQ